MRSCGSEDLSDGAAIICDSIASSAPDIKQFGFSKSERLCGKTRVAALIKKGKWGSTEHLRYCWTLAAAKTIERKEISSQSEASIADSVCDQNASFATDASELILESPAAQSLTNQLLVSVSKRYFKRAVKRNLLKRRIREAYRLHKKQLNPRGLQFMISYASKEVLDFRVIETEVQQILHRIEKAASK